MARQTNTPYTLHWQRHLQLGCVRHLRFANIHDALQCALHPTFQLRCRFSYVHMINCPLQVALFVLDALAH